MALLLGNCVFEANSAASNKRRQQRPQTPKEGKWPVDAAVTCIELEVGWCGVAFDLQVGVTYVVQVAVSDDSGKVNTADATIVVVPAGVQVRRQRAVGRCVFHSVLMFTLSCFFPITFRCPPLPLCESAARRCCKLLYCSVSSNSTPKLCASR